ncbi:sensor histidine kinase [Clostridium paraputrificum]|uniref:sensor histidine kinase n=1 Tax=Clostridium TaxID=1485 RepID=UPI003D3252D3
MNGFLIKFATAYGLMTSAYLFILYLLSIDNRPSDMFKLTIGYIIVFIILLTIFLLSLRNLILRQSEETCNFLDEVMSKKTKAKFKIYDETLYSKEQNKLKELVDILESEKRQYEVEKDNIQSLITDLSHQIKTPLANISMYNSTLLDRDVDKETEKEFLGAINNQIERLQWLVDGLVKISRLESNIISLSSEICPIQNTLAIAISGVYSKAKEKDIKININCGKDIKSNHDKKWTSEALYNIIENAIKYSEKGSTIDIEVESLEVFLRIDIIDYGMGIENKEINNVFKRFYRSERVREYNGVGIGLYLAREIVTREGGYIKVKSSLNNGSTFSVFLLKR